MTDMYTYYAGRKVFLKKRPDQFVVRALPDALAWRGLADATRTSSASSRVTCSDAELESLMTSAREIAPTHHAYEFADTPEEFLITDRIFVNFRKDTTSEEADDFQGKYGLVKRKKYSETTYLFQLTKHTGMNPVRLVVHLVENEQILESAEHDLNHRVTKFQEPIPTDPAYVSQWHLHTRSNSDQFDERSSAQVEAAWARLDSFGDPNVVIAITDDGCKLDHPEFNSPGKFAAWGYFDGLKLVKRGDADADPALMFDSGATHGTSSAGIAAAELDGVQTVGAAPSCRLAVIKWESEGESLLISDAKMLEALNYLDDKVDVVSNSWGNSPKGLWSQAVVSRTTELAATGGRRGKGIVFVWAAGNENCPIDHVSGEEIPHSKGFVTLGNDVFWVGVVTAGVFEHSLVNLPGVMWVSAVSSLAQRSHYSNYGSGISLCAPSNNSHTYQRLTVAGLGITTAGGRADGLIMDTFGGTSSAAPLVAGIAGLLISANPELSSEDVVSILKQTASKDLSMDRYSRTPSAIYDPDTSWDISPVAPFHTGDFIDRGDADGTWSPWFGHGRVDASAAVNEALDRLVSTLPPIA